MAFSPQFFLSNIRAKDGLARTNRFEVVLPIPTYINNFIGQSIFEKILNLPNSIIADITAVLSGSDEKSQSTTANPSISRYLALQCDTAELPGRMLQTADVKIYGPTFKVPYQTQYSDLNLTFICTNDFYERKLFDRWIESIHPSDTNNLRYAKDEATRYMTNIKVIQYDDFIRQIYAIEMIDAFPIGISSQPVSWGDESFHKVTVQFAYQKYNVVYDGNYDLVQAALSLFGSKAAAWYDNVTGSVTNPVGSVFPKLF